MIGCRFTPTDGAQMAMPVERAKRIAYGVPGTVEHGALRCPRTGRTRASEPGGEAWHFLMEIVIVHESCPSSEKQRSKASEDNGLS
jgi:hypothetical protein